MVDTLNDQRRDFAEKLYRRAVRGVAVRAISVWEPVGGDCWRRLMSLDTSKLAGRDSGQREFHVLFPPGSPRPSCAHLKSQEIGVICRYDGDAVSHMLDSEEPPVLGQQIADVYGNSIQGEEADPFGLTTFSVLTGEAAVDARARVSTHCGFRIIDIRDGDIMAPEIVDTLTADAPSPA